jgi:hypothetical protein
VVGLVTEQTGDVLADIDAALEGWHGTDAISRDAMRWAPEPPPGARRDLTPEEIEQVAADLRRIGQGIVASVRAAFGPGSEFAERFKLIAKALQATARMIDTELPPEFRAQPVVVKLPPLDARRTAALDAARSRSTGPAGPRLDGRRSR